MIRKAKDYASIKKKRHVAVNVACRFLQFLFNCVLDEHQDRQNILDCRMKFSSSLLFDAKMNLP